MLLPLKEASFWKEHFVTPERMAEKPRDKLIQNISLTNVIL